MLCLFASLCLPACLSRSLSVCQRGRSCWKESGSSPWQSSTSSYGSLATAGWLHTVTRRQGIIKCVLPLHHTHTHLCSCVRWHKHTTSTYNNVHIHSWAHCDGQAFISLFSKDRTSQNFTEKCRYWITSFIKAFGSRALVWTFGFRHFSTLTP